MHNLFLTYEEKRKLVAVYTIFSLLTDRNLIKLPETTYLKERVD